MLKPDRRVERCASQDQLRHPVQVQHFNKRLELPRSSLPINFLETPIPYPPRSPANCNEPLGLPVPIPRETRREGERDRYDVSCNNKRRGGGCVDVICGNSCSSKTEILSDITNRSSQLELEIRRRCRGLSALSIAISPPFLFFSSSSRSLLGCICLAFFLFLRGYVEHRSRGLDD